MAPNELVSYLLTKLKFLLCFLLNNVQSITPKFQSKEYGGAIVYFDDKNVIPTGYIRNRRMQKNLIFYIWYARINACQSYNLPVL